MSSNTGRFVDKGARLTRPTSSSGFVKVRVGTAERGHFAVFKSSNSRGVPGGTLRLATTTEVLPWLASAESLLFSM
jgi:hypothetical protein